MTDIVDRATRSRMMSGIRSKDTKPELVVRQHLFGQGLRYTLHNRNLPGKPDLVFRRYGVALFVNGCFWHMHEGCADATIPQTNRDFWLKKLQATRARDARVRRKLRASGWSVRTIWECQLSKERLNGLAKAIRGTLPERSLT